MSANYEVEEIISTEPKAYQGLDKTYFMTGGAQVYMFHKSENTPKVGDILDGSITYDRGQNMKFTKTKPNAYSKPYPVPPATQTLTQVALEQFKDDQPELAPKQVSLQEFADKLPALPKPTDKIPTAHKGEASYLGERTFKADPDKMKQEYTLAQATNMSIQRQVALKGAIELVVAGKSDDVVESYVDLMRLLSEPDWAKFDAPMDDRFENDLPPVESYDNLPTDEQVDDYDNDLDRAFAKDLADPKK